MLDRPRPREKLLMVSKFLRLWCILNLKVLLHDIFALFIFYMYQTCIGQRVSIRLLSIFDIILEFTPIYLNIVYHLSVTQFTWSLIPNQLSHAVGETLS